MLVFLSHFSFNQRLSSLLFFKALLMSAIIFYAGIGLGPDEAQYWTWSQALDWGYYSKPPGIAWQIWLGTYLFGQTEWGVRFASVGLAIIQAFAVYRLALAATLAPRIAYWCALCMAFSPLGMLGSLLAITDVGFLLCWTGACLSVVCALHHKREINFLYVGTWVMLGALFKWPMYFFWLFVIACRRSLFPQQTCSSLLVGICLSLIGLLPSIWWNWSHDWVTFRHVFATIQGGSEERAAGNVGEFLGSQALLLSPILFILLLYAFWHWFQKRKELNPSLYFCGFVTLASLSAVTLLSCFQKIQGNWVSFAYPTGWILLGWSAFQHLTRAWWAKLGLGVSLLLTLALVFLPSFYLVPSLAPYAPPYRLQPFKHNIGWEALTHQLLTRGYDPQKNFLLSDTYQTTSILSFYGPGQKRAYFLNLQGRRNNQFSYWPSMHEEQQGQLGYFVWIENTPHIEKQKETKMKFYQEELERYFEKVELIDFAPLIFDKYGKMVKGALIFRCQACKDLKLERSALY